MSSIQEYILALGVFINGTLIPFLFALGLLFFLYHTFRYFILKGDDTASREQAKQQAIYGIAGFVFLVSIWGIVNMFIYGLDLYRSYPMNSDYVEENSWQGGMRSFFDFSFGISNSDSDDSSRVQQNNYTIFPE